MKHALHYFHQSAVTTTVDDIPSILHNADNADSSSKEHGLPTPWEISRLFPPMRDLDLSLFLVGKGLKESALQMVRQFAWLGYNKKKAKPKHYNFRFAIPSGKKSFSVWSTHPTLVIIEMKAVTNLKVSRKRFRKFYRPICKTPLMERDALVCSAITWLLRHSGSKQCSSVCTWPYLLFSLYCCPWVTTS